MKNKMTKTITTINNNILEKIYSNRLIRTSVAKKSHQWFFHLYLGNYVKYQTAPFQQEMFRLTENQNLPLVALMAFRGSGKSTIVTCSTAIWSVLGKPNKKYVVILTKTQQQARQHLANIRYEFESNELLKNDFGPFEDNKAEWTSSSLTLPKYGAKIIAVSAEQGIRGLRHREHRPDLLLIDDVEDDQSIRNKDSRDKTYDWFVREVLPIGDENTKIMIVGNLLHRDSLMMRLKNDIMQGKREGIFKSYPIMDDNKIITWPAKFPTMEEINDLKLKIGDEKAWKQEYILKIVYDESRVIHPDWINYYDEINESKDSFRYNAIGIDPAISEATHADYTGIVSAKVYGNRENLRIYISRNPINKKMNFPKAVQVIKDFYKVTKHDGITKVFVESVAMQGSIAQMLDHEGVPAEEVGIKGDKRARLSVLTGKIKNAQILFPKKGAEELINQIIDLGTQNNDDLADAFSLLCNKIIEDDEKVIMPELWIF
jgi:phage terminase large subunit-like protein